MTDAAESPHLRPLRCSCGPRPGLAGPALAAPAGQAGQADLALRQPGVHGGGCVGLGADDGAEGAGALAGARLRGAREA